MSTQKEDQPEQEMLDEEPRSILLGIIAQLSKGMDLHRVTLPTFVLEPRSMLERITDFMSHPDLIVQASREPDPVKRFVQVVKYYLSGWHIRPKGVKKPYNPVLGEFFRCRWKLPADQSESFYIAEQVSHHPPMSAFYYCNPQNQIYTVGELRPTSKFLGNSAATIMQGSTRIRLGAFPSEEYVITMPNVYARGILFGTMLLELGDKATVRCATNNLLCEIEFTTKGYFSGTYNGLKGVIKKESTGEVLYNLSGKWTDTILIQPNAKNPLLNSTEQVFFDANAAKIEPKIVLPESEQEEYESRRLWSKVTANMYARNLDKATEEKSLIEDKQRKLRTARTQESAAEHVPAHFVRINDLWEFKHAKDVMEAGPQGGQQRIESLLFPQKE